MTKRIQKDHRAVCPHGKETKIWQKIKLKIIRGGNPEGKGVV